MSVSHRTFDRLTHMSTIPRKVRTRARVVTPRFLPLLVPGCAQVAEHRRRTWTWVHVTGDDLAAVHGGASALGAAGQSGEAGDRPRPDACEFAAIIQRLSTCCPLVSSAPSPASSKGRTGDFGSPNLGSNPSAGTMTGRSFLLAASVAITIVGATSACASGVDPLARRSDAVIGGTIDSADTGVVAVSRKSDPYSLCSGALIAPNLVLTARHCVAASPETIDCATSQFGVTAASNDVVVAADETITSRTPWYPSREVRTPPSSGVCGNDVALVILANRLPSSIAMPIIPRIDLPARNGEPLSVAGYGVTQPDDVGSAGTRRIRDGVQVLCIGAGCGDGVAPSELGLAEGTCSGDSGGPGLDAQGRVVSVTARGDVDCLIGVDSAVWSWSDFIRTAGSDAAVAAGVTPEYWASTGSSAPPPPDAGTTEPGDSGPLDTTTLDGGVAPSQLPTANTARACTGPSQCFAYEACYSDTSRPPGVCVPKCSATSHCATGRACDATLHVCLPKSDASSSCAVPSRPAAPTHAWLSGIVALLVVAVRRRGRAASDP